MAWERGELGVLDRPGFRVEALPADQDGARVRRRDLFHLVERWRIRLAEVGRAVHLPAEDEVRGGERRPIVPGEVRAERVGRFHAAVREDAPRIRVQLGQPIYEVRQGRLAGIEHGESGVEEPGRRAEAQAGDAQHLFIGDGVRLGASREDERAALVDARGLARPAGRSGSPSGWRRAGKQKRCETNQDAEPGKRHVRAPLHRTNSGRLTPT